MKKKCLDEKKEYGLVFSGGGTKGCYEIGVWKALNELNIKITAVAGTSIGAINGAFFCQGDYELAYNIWVNANTKEYLDLKNDTFFSLFIEAFSGGIDTAPLKKILKNYINEDNVRKSKINYGLATFSLTDMEPLMIMKKDIPNGQLIEYIIASASIPVLLKTQEIDGKKFIDGSLYINNPVPLLVKEGIKNIIEIDISGMGLTRKYDKEKLNLDCLYTIKNSLPLPGTLEFNNTKIQEGIDIGYYDTLRAFGKICGAKYYIKNKKSKYLGELTDKELLIILEKLHSDLEYSYINQKQSLIKILLEYTTEKINTKNILLICLEICAELLEVNRKKLYTYDTLYETVLKKYEDTKNLYSEKDLLSFVKTIKGKKLERISSSKIVIALLFMKEKDIMDDNFFVSFFKKAYLSYLFLYIIKKRS